MRGGGVDERGVSLLIGRLKGGHVVTHVHLDEKELKKKKEKHVVYLPRLASQRVHLDSHRRCGFSCVLAVATIITDCSGRVVYGEVESMKGE